MGLEPSDAAWKAIAKTKQNWTSPNKVLKKKFVHKHNNSDNLGGGFLEKHPLREQIQNLKWLATFTFTTVANNKRHPKSAQGKDGSLPEHIDPFN